MDEGHGDDGAMVVGVAGHVSSPHLSCSPCVRAGPRAIRAFRAYRALCGSITML